jgi:hypothetical protein
LNNNWIQYDDSNYKDIPESKIRTNAAYILFYKKKDIFDMRIKDVYPSIGSKDIFRGKPVKLQAFGQKLMGYIVDYRPTEPCPYHVRISNSNIDLFTK